MTDNPEIPDDADEPVDGRPEPGSDGRSESGSDGRSESGSDGRPAWRRRLSRPWLAGGGAAVLAAVLGVVLVWVSGESSACAAALAPATRLPAPTERVAAVAAPAPVDGQAPGVAVPAVVRAAPPDSGKVYKGKASYYDGGNSGGNCSFPGPPANRLYVALGPAQYAGGAACGSFLEVTGPKGKVRVMVLDRCAGCRGNKIDLSKQAFAKIADLSAGIVSIRYRFVVNPPVTGPLTFRIKGGASKWWFAVQVGNHGNPLKSVAVRRAGGEWRRAKRQPDNYWVVEGGLGMGPYEIRVTDIHGNEAVATGIQLKPRKVQRSRVRLYGTATESPRPSAPTASPAPPSGPVETPSAGPTSAPPAAPPTAPATRAAACG
ncbi:expansin EXLX1 family cellulose-binding protein [Micromonospora sp. HM5-17]|uniref:expansin EXLX1 family cellulose-binding protein n=1 Tax=Micromonospora sp. HM5-17 TaxID=2487710 RepID=UPI000F46DC7E|nr:expansin EXLX1 family cellulose-binding protein [Micromonospora sp. HM5-17]ROT31749.1 hypothetical protein EF879_15255 [Micromonospora sp. HM5-17]